MGQHLKEGAGGVIILMTIRHVGEFSLSPGFTFGKIFATTDAKIVLFYAYESPTDSVILLTSSSLFLYGINGIMV